MVCPCGCSKPIAHTACCPGFLAPHHNDYVCCKCKCFSKQPSCVKKHAKKHCGCAKKSCVHCCKCYVCKPVHKPCHWCGGHGCAKCHKYGARRYYDDEDDESSEDGGGWAGGAEWWSDEAPYTPYKKSCGCGHY